MSEKSEVEKVQYVGFVTNNIRNFFIISEEFKV